MHLGIPLFHKLEMNWTLLFFYVACATLTPLLNTFICFFFSVCTLGVLYSVFWLYSPFLQFFPELAPKGSIFTATLFTALRKECGSQRLWMTTRQHLDTARQLHVWTQGGCDSIHKTWASPSQMKFQCGEEIWAHGSPPSCGASDECYKLLLH